jgi:hypothetical protein
MHHQYPKPGEIFNHESTSDKKRRSIKTTGPKLNEKQMKNKKR